METFFTNGFIFIISSLVLTFLKLTLPTLSFKGRTSLIISSGLALYYLYQFSNDIINGDIITSPLFFLMACLIYIYKGGRNVGKGTMTGVFNLRTNQCISVLKQGAFNWIDPIFEWTSVGIDGERNTAIDLQRFKVEIHETPRMRTATQGIQAQLKDIVVNLKFVESEELDKKKRLKENKRLLEEIFSTEGGAISIHEAVVSYVDEFFRNEVSKISADDLELKREDIKKDLIDKLKEEINSFCDKNEYPYHIINEPTIGDVVVDEEYMKALAQKTLTILEQNAQDTIAEKVIARVKKVGNEILPGRSEVEQLNAAKVLLKYTTENVEHKTFGVDPILRDALIEIAKIIKK